MDSLVAPSPKNCPVHALATAWEILCATSCSIITSAYTLHHESRVRLQETISSSSAKASQKEDLHPGSFQYEFLKISDEEEGHFSFMLNPPPALMLASCLVLGCAISSFAYRRQDRDKLQTPIFIATITLACIIGFAWDLNANLIMLAMIPWALCMAMVLCTVVNSMVENLSRRRIMYAEVRIRCCELGEVKEKDSKMPDAM